MLTLCMGTANGKNIHCSKFEQNFDHKWFNSNCLIDARDKDRSIRGNKFHKRTILLK